MTVPLSPGVNASLLAANPSLSTFPLLFSLCQQQPLHSSISTSNQQTVLTRSRWHSLTVYPSRYVPPTCFARPPATDNPARQHCCIPILPRIQCLLRSRPRQHVRFHQGKLIISYCEFKLTYTGNIPHPRPYGILGMVPRSLVVARHHVFPIHRTRKRNCGRFYRMEIRPFGCIQYCLHLLLVEALVYPSFRSFSVGPFRLCPLSLNKGANG